MALQDVVLAMDAQLHPLVLGSVDREGRWGALREELSWAVEIATVDLEFARDYRDRMPRDGAEPTDYLNRWVRISADLEVLMGPRHRALDPGRPFVAVDAASRRIRPDDLGALIGAAATTFRPFGPRSVVFIDRAPAQDWPGATPDMRLLAGALDALRGRPVDPRLTVTHPSDRCFYERYLDAYEAFLAEQPAAREWTQPKSWDAMRAAQEHGAVLDLTIDGDWAGLVAGEPGSQGGLRGVRVVEAFLLPRYRGMGLGAQLSIALAREVPADATGFLFGTIHHENRPAYGAARAAGRHDIGGEVVVPIP